MENTLSMLIVAMRDIPEVERLVRMIFRRLQEKQTLELMKKYCRASLSEQTIRDLLGKLQMSCKTNALPEELRKAVWEICLADIRQGRQMNK